MKLKSGVEMLSFVRVSICLAVGMIAFSSHSAWAMHKALLAAKLYRLEMKEVGDAATAGGPTSEESGRSVLGAPQNSRVQSELKVHWKALGLAYPAALGPSRVDAESMRTLEQEFVQGRRGAEAEGHEKVIAQWPGFKDFSAGFIKIPSGFLPNGLPMGGFEAAKYPVTRDLWNQMMPDFAVSLGANPSCPVTEVAWDNSDGSPAEVQVFLERLNAKTAGLGCVYDLPTDPELWYLIRGDVSGKSTARYSLGVAGGSSSGIERVVLLNDENVDDYITHEGNSSGRLRPVGLKRVNAFGLELGNVWKLSKDPYYVSQPKVGRTARGGCWFFDLSCASSHYKTIAYAGDRQDFIGFSLVRRCSSDSH